MAKIFVATDTHGECDRFKELLAKANFNYEEDELRHLGDVCDRGPDSYGVVEELLKVKNLIAIRGNHDEWLLRFADTGCIMHPNPYYFKETLDSYLYQSEDYLANPIPSNIIPKHHLAFYKGQLPYYLDEQGRFFTHAGYNRREFVEDQDLSEFAWNRDFFKQAMCLGPDDKLNDVNGFKQVFIGHTCTIGWQKNGKNIDKPIYKGQVVNLDTGACFGGKLSMLDITDSDNHILYQN